MAENKLGQSTIYKVKYARQVKKTKVAAAQLNSGTTERQVALNHTQISGACYSVRY